MDLDNWDEWGDRVQLDNVNITFFSSREISRDGERDDG